MGRGRALTLEEQTQIRVLHEENYSAHQIGRKINRSQNVVSAFLRSQGHYGKNMKGCTHSATTTREKRKILRLASNSTDSISKIRAKSGVNASVSTVRRVINSAPHLKLYKLKKNHV